MGEHRAGPFMNIGLLGTIVFSFLISYASIHGLVELIKTFIR
jgi:hypothetical protein